MRGATPQSAAWAWVPAGTSGAHLAIEHRLDAYVDAIASGHDLAVDVGRVHYRATDGARASRWFVNVLSAGMGGLVDRYVADTTKSLGGKAAYFLASARALAVCARGRLRCNVGLSGQAQERRMETFMIAICNGRYFGAGMHVAPMAKADDGRFEVVSMDAPNKLAFIGSSRKIYEGRHLSAPGVTHFGCDHIAVDLENYRRTTRLPAGRRRRTTRGAPVRNRAGAEEAARPGSRDGLA